MPWKSRLPSLDSFQLYSNKKKTKSGGGSRRVANFLQESISIAFDFIWKVLLSQVYDLHHFSNAKHQMASLRALSVNRFSRYFVGYLTNSQLKIDCIVIPLILEIFYQNYRGKKLVVQLKFLHYDNYLPIFLYLLMIVTKGALLFSYIVTSINTKNHSK